MPSIILCLFFSSILWAGSKIGKISYVEGVAQIIARGKTKAVKVNMVLKQGYTIVTQSDSRVEVTYSNGDIIRIDKNSSITLEGSATQGKPRLKKGDLWSNIKKLSKGKSGFQVQTPTATAAVRGTIFQVQVRDSSSTVKLFEGKVDVGPPGKKEKTASTWGPPVEVSGPSEVTLDSWLSLDPGQMIHVNLDGTYLSESFDEAAAIDQSSWEKFNKARDKELVKK